MKRLRLQVLPLDIETAKRQVEKRFGRPSECCPLAQALRRASDDSGNDVNFGVGITLASAKIEGKFRSFDLSGPAVRFASAFDAGEDVHPQTFHLNAVKEN